MCLEKVTEKMIALVINLRILEKEMEKMDFFWSKKNVKKFLELRDKSDV